MKRKRYLWKILSTAILLIFQKRIIEDETMSTGPQPFLESLFPDRSLPWKIPEIPPRLQQLHDMLFERPAVYFLEPPGIWNDRFPLTPKWKIYDITFIWLFCFGFFVTVNVSQLLLHLKELISFKFKWTLQVLFINAIHVMFINAIPTSLILKYCRELIRFAHVLFYILTCF